MISYVQNNVDIRTDVPITPLNTQVYFYQFQKHLQKIQKKYEFTLRKIWVRGGTSPWLGRRFMWFGDLYKKSRRKKFCKAKWHHRGFFTPIGVFFLTYFTAKMKKAKILFFFFFSQKKIFFFTQKNYIFFTDLFFFSKESSAKWKIRKSNFFSTKKNNFFVKKNIFFVKKKKSRQNW